MPGPPACRPAARRLAVPVLSPGPWPTPHWAASRGRSARRVSAVEAGGRSGSPVRGWPGSPVRRPAGRCCAPRSDHPTHFQLPASSGPRRRTAESRRFSRCPGLLAGLKVRGMITSPVPSCPVPSWSRSVSRRGDRLPVRQARPPGSAGRCRGGTSTYLPHVNVPFSHPSGGRAQKDGRKVRWCCQGTFTLGRSPRPASSTRHGPPGGARRAHPLSR